MRKNYFGKLLAAMLLLFAGFSITSCNEVNSVFNSDNGTGESLPDAELTVTANGATFTINTLADVTEFLSQVKAKINAKTKAGGTFNITIIANGTLATTSSDNTITLPALTEGYNVKLNLQSNLNTAAAPLTVKQAGDATTSYKNKIDVTFLNSDVDLVLDLPGTRTTLNNANSLQMIKGLAIVKEGGAIKTYVYAAEENTDQISYGASSIGGGPWYYGIAPRKREILSDDESYTYTDNEVIKEEGGAYRFDNLKIVKGAADYSMVRCDYSDYSLEKLTIAADAFVVLNYQPSIKTIEGEGDGTAKIGFNNWWQNDPEKKTYNNSGSFYYVNDIKNLTVTEFLPSGTDGTVNRSYVNDVPAGIENVTFKFNYISFRENQVSSATVTNCKFESGNDNKNVNISVPAQSSDVTSQKFKFSGCSFSEGFKFNLSGTTRVYEYDADGNPVYYKTPYYEYYDSTLDTYLYVESQEDIPDGASWWGPYTYYQQKFTIVKYKDFYATLALDNCTIGGNPFTTETEFIDGFNTYEGFYVRFEIDGVTYRAIWDYDAKKYVLIPA